jgi:hypothetical protein
VSKPLDLRVLTDRFAVVRLDPGQDEPAWVGGEVTCVARTPGELSILCAEDRVPDGLRTNSGWRCLEVAGPLDFSEVGILSSLSSVLAEAAISVFVFSTFDTDYLLVQSDRLDPTIAAFEQAGHRITRPDQ